MSAALRLFKHLSIVSYVFVIYDSAIVLRISWFKTLGSVFTPHMGLAECAIVP